MTGLGQFAQGVASWRRMMAAMSDDAGRWHIFGNAAHEIAGYVPKGLDRTLAADQLHNMATAYGLTDVDTVQQVISDAFREIEQVEHVPDLIEEPRAAVDSKSRFALRVFEAITMTTAANYLIKGIIPRTGLAVVWGPAKCGKSFWTFDLVMHVALGWQYRGHRVQQGPVVYLALEGGHGFRNRVEAWRRRHLNGQGNVVPFYMLDVPVDLIADRDKLVQAIKAQLADQVPAAVVIDTLNRALIGDENRSDDMAKFIRASDLIRTAFGCAVIIVHHCGVAGSRPRGHTSLSGADDVQIAVERSDDGTITVKVEHMKDGDASAPMACRLERVELGQDDDGDPITSCVVVPIEGIPSAGKTAGTSMTGNQRRFLDILRDALLDPPDAHKTTINIPGGRTAISREWLKTCCISKGWLDDDGSNKSRAKLSEMINTLAGKRMIGTTKLFVWLAQ